MIKLVCRYCGAPYGQQHRKYPRDVKCAQYDVNYVRKSHCEEIDERINDYYFVQSIMDAAVSDVVADKCNQDLTLSVVNEVPCDNTVPTTVYSAISECAPSDDVGSCDSGSITDCDSSSSDFSSGW